MPDEGAADDVSELLEGLLRSAAPLDITTLDPPHGEQQVLGEAPVTPRRQALGAEAKAQSKWAPSPCIWDTRHGSPSPPSEVSTYAPSSLSLSAPRLSVESPGRRSWALACACRPLAAVLKSVVARRLYWSLSHWGSTIGDPGGNWRREEALSRRLQEAESRAEDDRREAQAWQQKGAALKIRARGASAAVGALRARLEEACVREEALLCGRAGAEEQLASQWREEQTVLGRERQAHDELRAEVESLREAQELAVQRAAELTARGAAERRRWEASEQTCAKQEARLARQMRWREDAQLQINEMIQCGESLERERAELRQELARARKGGSRELEALQQASAEETQLCEVLQARVVVLQEDHVKLRERLVAEQQGHKEDVASCSLELVSLRKSRADLLAELRESQASNEAAESRAAQAARGDLQAAWERERRLWAQANEDLERRANTTRRELEAAEVAERAEAIAAAEAQANEALARRDEAQQEEGSRRRAQKAAWEAVRTEAAACTELKGQLEHRLKQASQLEEALEEQLAQEAVRSRGRARRPDAAPDAAPPPAAASTIDSFLGHESAGAAGPARAPASTSGPPTPRSLNELDAYAELVERLRAEVEQERAAREASANSLAMLRASYRLLLQRASGGTMGMGGSDPVRVCHGLDRDHGGWRARADEEKASILPSAARPAYRGLP